MHPSAYAYVKRVLVDLPPRAKVVELGSRNLNGTVRNLFKGASYLGVDIRPGSGVDVVADAASYEPPTPPDTVVCVEVLEHTADAPLILANAAHMLAPGGVLIATMATDPRPPHSAIDGERLKPGEYYRNVSPEQLVAWLHEAGFADLVWDLNRRLGDLYVTAWKEPSNAEEPELHDLRELRAAAPRG